MFNGINLGFKTSVTEDLNLAGHVMKADEYLTTRLKVFLSVFLNL